MSHLRFQVVIFGLTFFAATFLVGVRVADGACNETEFRRCPSIFPDSQTTKFSYTREELEASCRLSDEFVKCINRTGCATLEQVQDLVKVMKRATDFMCGTRMQEFLDNAQCLGRHELEKSLDFCKEKAKRQLLGPTPCETTSQLISCTVQTVNTCCGKKTSDLIDEFMRLGLQQSASLSSDCQYRSDLIVEILPLCTNGGSTSVHFLHGSQILAMVLVIFLSLLRKDWL